MNDYLVRWSNPGETIDSRGFSFSFYTFVLRSTRSFEFLLGYKVVKVVERGLPSAVLEADDCPSVCSQKLLTNEKETRYVAATT